MKSYFIYKITNIINGKVYIGQSTNPDARWRRHKSDAKLSNKKGYLYSAIRKSGIDKFIYEIIAQAKTLDDIDDAEITCIKQYRSSDRKYGYNISYGGNGKRLVSNETRKKISKFRTGKQATEETKKKMSQSMIGKNKGNKNGMFGTSSEETYCSKLTFKLAYKIRKEYASGKTSSLKLAKKYGVSKKTILNILHNRTYIRK